MTPPLHILALGPVASGAVVFRRAGVLHVAIAVKGTFALTPDGRAAVCAPQDLLPGDLSFDKDPAQSLRFASDLVPFRPKADLTLTGHAYAPPGRSVPAMSVRLAVYRGEPLVDKTIHVFGARHREAPNAVVPFQRMSLRYERAYGGPSCAANPVGVGSPPPSAAMLPNLVDPSAPDRPIGFGPLSAYWPGRRSLRGSFQPHTVAPSILDLPDDLSWDYFHAAPVDQRVPFLRGDEWIVLDGLHPALPRVQTELPSAKGVARVHHEGGGAEREVELALDTLSIDGDAQTCALVWRGRFPLPGGEEELGDLRITCAVEMPGQAVAWPRAGGATAKDVPPAESRQEPQSPPAVARRRTPAIPVLNRTPLLLVTLPWQVSPPRDSLTVLVKGTFDLVPGKAAVLRPRTDPVTCDAHREDDPKKSLTYASDFAIFKPRADVVLTGWARPARGPTDLARVTFRFGHPGNRFDRSIAVFGERRWHKALGVLTPGDPSPFEAMPLVYEHAFGGARFEANPLGAGHGTASGAGLPNLEDPEALLTHPGDTPAPACFAPVPVLWKERWSKLGTYDARWLKTRWPYFPEDFDWGYFQAAPRPQQLAYLAGDEPYEIVGMHLEHPVFGGRLPGLRPRCVLEETKEAGGRLREVVLRLDTASFDVEARKLDLVWRGVLDVTEEEAPEIARLLLAKEDLGLPSATLEQVRDACLATELDAPIAESPEATRPANDTATEEDPRIKALRAEVDEKLKAGREQLRAAGIAMPDASAPPPPPRPMPDPAPVEASLRAAKMSEKEIAGILETLRSAKATPDEPAPPTDLRARVIAMLEANQPFDRMDLAGADLSRLDLGGRSFAGALLKDARLCMCNLAAADLSYAQLGGADLTMANLDAANLTGADLTSAELATATLEGAALSSANLTGARGDGASFRAAKGMSTVFADGTFRRARFDEADLPSADFSRATLDGATFLGAKAAEIRLFDARGTGVRFDGASLPEARADRVTLLESSLQAVDARRSTWEMAVLDGATFRGSMLAGASFVRASCERAVFSGADLTGGRFSRARLASASFLKANLMKALFDRADLTRADLRASNLHQAETWKAKLAGAQLETAIVTQSKLKGRG